MVLNRDEMLSLAAYVLMSSYRIKALSVLNEHEVMTPKRIALECNVRPNHISKFLTELKERGCVVCINPEVRKGKLYKITSLGKEILALSNEIKL